MQENIYEENIYSRWNLVILGAVSLALLSVLIYQFLIGPVGDRPAPNWFLLVMFLFFLMLTINFARLSIRITPRFITVGYRVIRYSVSWENVADCYLDEASAIRYGGWGIRLGRVRGKWRLVYNVLGSPRVVVYLKRGKIREFVFSTKNPEQTMKTIKQQIGKMSG